MGLKEDIDYLVDFGLFNEEAVFKIADLIHAANNVLNQGNVHKMVDGINKEKFLGLETKNIEDQPKKRSKKLDISKEELSKMYLEDKMTAREISMKLGCSSGTVAKRLMALGISKRS